MKLKRSTSWSEAVWEVRWNSFSPSCLRRLTYFLEDIWHRMKCQVLTIVIKRACCVFKKMCSAGRCTCPSSLVGKSISIPFRRKSHTSSIGLSGLTVFWGKCWSWNRFCYSLLVYWNLYRIAVLYYNNNIRWITLLLFLKISTFCVSSVFSFGVICEV